MTSFCYSQQRKWADERAEWQRKIEEVKNQIEESLGNLKTETTHYQNLQNTLDVKKSEETPLVVEGKAIQRRLSMYFLYFIYSHHWKHFILISNIGEKSLVENIIFILVQLIEPLMVVHFNFSV